jgi:hypothetical protein
MLSVSNAAVVLRSWRPDADYRRGSGGRPGSATVTERLLDAGRVLDCVDHPLLHERSFGEKKTGSRALEPDKHAPRDGRAQTGIICSVFT